MFARAAIVGRVARERSEARRQFLQEKQELKKKTPQAPLRQRCFIPILRGPCTAVALGCFLILIGAIMCNFAFHAKRLSLYAVQTSNGNETVTEIMTNAAKYEALKSLTFVGPGMMGLGIFTIIIACVLLLDKRDKVLKKYIDSMLHTQQEISMELSFRAVTSTDTPKPSEALSSTGFSETNELKTTNAKRVYRKVSLPSLPYVPNYSSKNLEQVHQGQEIELATVHEWPDSGAGIDNLAAKDVGRMG